MSNIETVIKTGAKSSNIYHVAAYILGFIDELEVDASDLDLAVAGWVAQRAYSLNTQLQTDFEFDKGYIAKAGFLNNETGLKGVLGAVYPKLAAVKTVVSKQCGLSATQAAPAPQAKAPEQVRTQTVVPNVVVNIPPIQNIVVNQSPAATERVAQTANIKAPAEESRKVVSMASKNVFENVALMMKDAAVEGSKDGLSAGVLGEVKRAIMDRLNVPGFVRRHPLGVLASDLAIPAGLAVAANLWPNLPHAKTMGSVCGRAARVAWSDATKSLVKDLFPIFSQFGEMLSKDEEV